MFHLGGISTDSLRMIFLGYHSHCGLTFDKGNQAPVRCVDESMCVSHWVTDSPWVFFGWIVRAGTQAFPEGTTRLLAGQASLHTNPLDLGLSTGHWLVSSSLITSFPSTHKLTIASNPLRPVERGSHTWKEDCFVLYLQQKVRKRKLLTIINNWRENTKQP